MADLFVTSIKCISLPSLPCVLYLHSNDMNWLKVYFSKELALAINVIVIMNNINVCTIKLKYQMLHCYANNNSINKEIKNNMILSISGIYWCTCSPFSTEKLSVSVAIKWTGRKHPGSKRELRSPDYFFLFLFARSSCSNLTQQTTWLV